MLQIHPHTQLPPFSLPLIFNTELFYQDIEGHLYGTVGKLHACIGGIIAAVIKAGASPRCEVFDNEASIHYVYACYEHCEQE